MHVLIAEDDAAIADGLARVLQHAQHSTAWAADGLAAMQALDAGGIDLLVLDLGLPKLHGAEVLRRLRARSPQLPVLLISAIEDAQIQLARQGLKVDAFLPKPFSLNLFEASVRKLLEPPREAASQPLRFGPLSCEPDSGVARLDGKVIELTEPERSLLELLVQRNGRPVGRQEMAERLAPGAGAAELESCVDGLRKRLASSSVRIVAVRGMGYCISEATSVDGG